MNNINDDFEFDDILQQMNNRDEESDSEFNLESDLRSASWFVEKLKSRPAYAQNLYAALCNNTFKKISIENTSENIIKILMEDIKPWRCSWRAAGRIVSSLVEKGNYMDYYCSGMEPEWDSNLHMVKLNYVPEGCVTIEITEDLRQIGWKVIPDEE